MDRFTKRSLSRRSLIQASAAGSAAALLAANSPSNLTWAQNGAPATADDLNIPDPAVELPSEDLTFRWVDSGDLKALFYEQFFAAYQQARPNISIQYDQLPWEEIQQIVPLGVRNDNAHDVFALPLNIPAAQAVREGWVAPLDEVIPDFDNWKASLPFGSSIPGIHEFNGRTYSFPLSSNKRHGSLLFHNRDLFERADLDPEEAGQTFDSFRAACRQLTETSDGEVYGLVLGANSAGVFSDFVRNLGRRAGSPASGNAPLPDIDWRTGEYAFTSDGYLEAIELLVAIREDGSIFPGSTSLIEIESRSMFAQGVAGFHFNGPWVIPAWRRQNPELDFGATGLIQADPQRSLPITFEESGANLSWVFVNSPYKDIAGDMYSYISSLEGQTALVVMTGGNLRAMNPEANAAAQATEDLDPVASRVLDIYEEEIRLGPMPVIRNPDVLNVYLNLRTPTPSFGETMQGIFAGQLRDVNQAMTELKNRYESELDRAIGVAQDEGSDVSRDDFVFSDWDPSEEYSQEDY